MISHRIIGSAAKRLAQSTFYSVLKLHGVILKFFASIKHRFLHFGQNRGKFFSSVSFLIFSRVFPPQSGQRINSKLSTVFTKRIFYSVTAIPETYSISSILPVASYDFSRLIAFSSIVVTVTWRRSGFSSIAEVVTNGRSWFAIAVLILF